MKTPILAALLAATLVAIGCTAPERKRPANVPKDAVWAGRNGKGNFISCGYGMGRELIPCTVYDDKTGTIAMEGKFALTGRPRDTSPTSFRYSWFDGNRIYLMDGSVLNPTTEPAPTAPDLQVPGPELEPAADNVTPAN